MPRPAAASLPAVRRPVTRSTICRSDPTIVTSWIEKLFFIRCSTAACALAYVG